MACYYKQEFSPYISCYKNDPEGHYLWIKIDKALGFENDLFAAVCYFPPAKSTAYKGRDRLEPNFPYTRLNNDIFSFSMKKSSCDFIVVGDFNSRIGDAQAPEAHRHGLSRDSADKKINKFGLPLMDICDKNDLIICNGVTQVILMSLTIPGTQKCKHPVARNSIEKNNSGMLFTPSKRLKRYPNVVPLMLFSVNIPIGYLLGVFTTPKVETTSQLIDILMLFPPTRRLRQHSNVGI